jgi:2-polyprenyl-3-methyl-5-hydroxy-6-metoxy-1,4-benzoquinol methylase
MIRPVRIGSPFERSLRTYNGVPQSPRWRVELERLPLRWPRFIARLDRSLDRADPVKRMHYKFGVSTNQRGAATLELIETRRPVAGAAVLDIGCAYGGFLLAALARGASRAVGLDIDRRLLDLARANLGDQGVLERTVLSQGDATDAEICAKLGRFDVIICNDVIEHVVDPELLAERIVSMLAPSDSVAFLEIPNLRSSRYIASDGHFQLFAITALEHDDAEAYYHCFFPDSTYTVGHVLELDRYRQMFESRGCRVEVEPYPRAGNAVELCRDDYAAFAAKLADFAPPGVPPALLATLKARAQVFIDDAREDAAKVAAGTLSASEHLTRNYDPFWRLFVRRG